LNIQFFSNKVAKNDRNDLIGFSLSVYFGFSPCNGALGYLWEKDDYI